MKESDIRFEKAGFAVYRESRISYSVVVSYNGSTIGFEQYNDESLALARAKYLAENSDAERLHSRLAAAMRSDRN